MKPDVVIVGAGLTGLTIAERCASQGQRVLVVDQRSHFGGNCFDETDEHGTRIHRYGPHVFHTASHLVFEYLSQFTDWRPYEHRVLTHYDGRLMPMPVNAATLEMFFDVSPFESETEVEGFLAKLQVPVGRPENSRDVCLGRVGHELYEALFRPYTIKQWGRDPADMAPGVCGRIPVRTTYDDRYFVDEFQQLPADGYTAMFERMIDSPLIDVQLEEDGRMLRKRYRDRPLVWTGPLDQAFGTKIGPLPWRSIEFELVHVESTELVQQAPVINEPDPDVPYTRSTEYRWLTGQHSSWSCIHREHPSSSGEPHYPVPSAEANGLVKEYTKLADAEPNLIVCGRLGRYQYLEMGQAVASALKTWRSRLDVA